MMMVLVVVMVMVIVMVMVVVWGGGSVLPNDGPLPGPPVL